MQVLLRRQAIRRRMYCTPTLHSTRRFSKPVYPANTFNVVQRKGHGPLNYFQQWEALIFSHADYRWATFWIWSTGIIACCGTVHSLWNSAWRDPEVRLRPHRKAWHLDDSKIMSDKYRFGGFKWYPGCGARTDYIRKIHREGFDEPGQNGFEELEIPKL